MTAATSMPDRQDRLRVGICLSLYWPIESGAERQARRQAHELTRRGHEVTVYTRRLPGCPARERDGDVMVRRAISTCEAGPLFGATFLMSLAWRLWRDRHALDLLHCHQAAWEAVAAGWIHRRTGLPTLVQPAAGGPYGEVALMQQAHGQRILRGLILGNTHFVAISQQIEAELHQWGVPDARLDRLASGIDVAQFAPDDSTQEAHLPPRPRVLYLGRLHPQKNLGVLLRAWQIVRQAGRGGHLLLAGDGPQRGELEQLAAACAVGDSVHFLGAQPDPLPLLQAADVFVLPSISEGMSNSLLEAMACGLPSIVSDAGGNVDLIEPEVTGLVADATTPVDLARQLERMLGDPGLRQRCGAQARRVVCDRYSLESVVDRYESLYYQLVSRARQERGSRRAGFNCR